MELARLINESDKPIVITVKGTPLGYAIPANGRFHCVLCQGEFVHTFKTIMCGTSLTVVRTGAHIYKSDRAEDETYWVEETNEPICDGPLGLDWDGSMLVGDYRFPAAWCKAPLIYVQDGVGIDEVGGLIPPVTTNIKYPTDKRYIAASSRMVITGDRMPLFDGKEIDLGNPVLSLRYSYYVYLVQTCNGDVFHSQSGRSWDKIGQRATAIAASGKYFSYADSAGKVYIYECADRGVRFLSAQRCGKSLISELDVCKSHMAVKYRDGTFDIIDWHSRKSCFDDSFIRPEIPEAAANN